MRISYDKLWKMLIEKKASSFSRRTYLRFALRSIVI